MGYLIEGHPENGQALTQSLYVPAPEKKKKKQFSAMHQSPQNLSIIMIFFFST